jgi:hypothetical protein
MRANGPGGISLSIIVDLAERFAAVFIQETIHFHVFHSTPAILQ